MKTKLVAIFIVVLLVVTVHVFAMDGNYSATVTTANDSYDCTIDVKQNQVVRINWPNGRTTELHDADISENGEAQGYDDNGKLIEIDIDDYVN